MTAGPIRISRAKLAILRADPHVRAADLAAFLPPAKPARAAKPAKPVAAPDPQEAPARRMARDAAAARRRMLAEWGRA